MEIGQVRLAEAFVELFELGGGCLCALDLFVGRVIAWMGQYTQLGTDADLGAHCSGRC